MNIEKRVEKEIHSYLDDLASRGFYGEITFYFQNGVIGNIRDTERLDKGEILTRYVGYGNDNKRVLIARRKTEAV